MASSPPTPTNSSLPNPKKRPSLGVHSLTTQPEPKRQKIQPHPLRQSSYPDPAASGFYASQTPNSARSETGSIANSLVSGSVAGTTKGKRPRGRPRKTTQLPDDDVEAASRNLDSANPRATAGEGKSQVSVRGGGHDDEADDPEDDDDDGLETVPLDEQERLRRKEETQRISRLQDAFTPDQTERYAQFVRAKISKVALRKIVNQTVSQSVTANPLMAIQVYSKNYIGEIIERAREVQAEWAVVGDGEVQREREARKEETERSQGRLDAAKARVFERTPEEEVLLGNAATDYRALSYEINVLAGAVEKSRTREREPVPNRHRGGLLPEHVREALRRYRADGEAGGVGFAGLSHHLLGVPGSGTWRVGQGLGGRRLFK